MSWPAVRRLIARMRRSRLEHELDEEIRQHLEMRTRALIESGMDPREAASEARRLFGNVTSIREITRDAWSFSLLESVLSDVAYGSRIFRRQPVFSAVALASMAIAIAASAGVFALLNAAMLRPLPGEHDSPIYRIFTSGSRGGTFGGSSYADIQSIAQSNDVFATTCVTAPVRANLDIAGSARTQAGQIADAGCFSMMRMTPAAGRFYGSGPGDDASVIISYRLWERDLGGDPAAVGGPILVNGRQAVIVGVAPRGFAGTSLDGGADFWIQPPLASEFLSRPDLRNRGDRGFTAYVQLRHGVEERQAAAALHVLVSRLKHEDPKAWTDATGSTRRFTILDERRARFAATSDGGFVIVGGAFGIIAAVVAIACLNLATMLLALGVSRTREISVRLALGASYGRVLRQLVTECLSIGLCGALLGVLAVHVIREVAITRIPTEVPALDIVVDWRVVLVALGLGLVTPLLFGLAPAVHALRLAITDGMRTSRAPRRFGRIAFGSRETLIVLQVATSCALLLVSSLFARALIDARTTGPGFRTDGIAAVEVDMTLASSSDPATLAVLARLLEAAARTPGVDRVATAGIVPLTGTAIHVDARADSEPASEARRIDLNVVGPGYFDTLGIPLLSGRDFDRRDSAASTKVAVVNTALAQAFWNTGMPVGRSIVLGNGERLEVVGVVGNHRYLSMSGADEPLFFVPFEQSVRERMVIHAALRGSGTLGALERAIRSADARVMVGRIGTVSSLLEEARIGERMFQWIGASAGLLQFVLAIMGLWALVSYTVQRRTTEMGVRLALGATPSRLIGLTMRLSLVLIVAGVTLGSAGGLVAASVARSTTSGLAPLDLALTVPVGIVLALAASVAAWIPARAVGRADPAAALRHE